MPEFMILMHGSEPVAASLPPSETRELLERQAAYEQRLRALSAYVDGERLRPSGEGRRVASQEGEPSVELGPFAPPTLEAYCVVQADDLDAALALAADCPVSPGSQVEVRPVMKGRSDSAKTNQPGRIFAFVVLGKAESERSWIELMDQIDERTSEHFPVQHFRGGLRLREPSQGRQINATAGRRATFDGPFLESKEVIGGIFFMRMAGLAEAVEFAQTSAFVERGSLEIRELWRS